MKTYDIDLPLLTLRGKDGACLYWTIRNALEGLQIFGGIGSGKTSGSGQTIAGKLLEAGLGGLVLTVKTDEKNLWVDYCKKAGRLNDLIIVDPSHGNYFNFLDYEGGVDGNTENIVQVLKTVIRASNDKTGRSEDSFWEDSLDMLLSNLIDLCKLAFGSLSIQKLYEVAQNLPYPSNLESNKETIFKEVFERARRNVFEQVKCWKKSLTDSELTNMATSGNFEEVLCNTVTDARTFKYMSHFFLDTYLTLADKTRSIIDFSLTGFLFRLMRDPVYKMFCQHPSNFTPDDSYRGKIILINLPVKTYNKVGRDCQILFKYIWQRAMERRDVEVDGLPVFLWADEAQHFLHEYDAEYQATARSSRIATVYISQNLPNYLANMGGLKSDHRVKSFLGTMATKIFHANVDVETNKYASELIGDGYFRDSSTTTDLGGDSTGSISQSLKIDRIVRPEAFAKLKTGAKSNNYESEAFLHLQGNTLALQQNFIKISFKQSTNN